jgi:hypothetical protein
MLDPMFMQALQGMQGTQALQPGFDTSPMGGAPGAGGGDLAAMLGSLKAPTSQKPVFSGGVPGAGLPFVQPIQNMMTPSLQGSQQRINAAGQMPSLGEILAGSLR